MLNMFKCEDLPIYIVKIINFSKNHLELQHFQEKKL